MSRQVNLPVWAGLSVAIFLCLMFVSNLASENEVKGTPVQQAYDDLALALNDAGIYPGVGQGEMLSALAAQTLDNSKLNPPHHGSSLSVELSLGTVIRAGFQESGAISVTLKPGNYKELKPGALRQALQKISRIPYSRQLKEMAGISPSTRSFTVSIIVNARSNTISPGFTKQQCNTLLITQP